MSIIVWCELCKIFQKDLAYENVTLTDFFPATLAKDFVNLMSGLYFHKRVIYDSCS